MTLTERAIPTEDEVRGYFERCTNWGRWGPDDSKGTLNLISPAVRLAAVRLVQSGRAVSLARPVNAVGGPGNWTPAQHYLRVAPDFSIDYIGLSYHGYATTHLDALCHLFWQGTMWNGKPATEVTSLGARSGDIAAWSDGITTRGVLLDIPRLRGVDYVEIERPVRGYELEAAADRQGVELRGGDAVCVYSGREKFYQANPHCTPGVRPQPGLQADTIPVLQQYDAALLVWDMMDNQPTPYRVFEEPPRAPGPVHTLAIVYLGLPLLDNARLDALADACAQAGQYEFLLTVNPLIVPGGTGSPVNPIAIL